MSASVAPVVGSVVECLYPKHGRRNILVRQRGEVVRVGVSKRNGPFITINRATTGHRSLSLSKIVALKQV